MITTSDTATEQRVAALLPLIRHRVPDLALVYLFGSHAKGGAHPQSDVDLAILAGAPIAPSACFELAQELAGELVVEQVDVVDLVAASSVMKKEVVANGSVVFQSSPDTRHAFEGRALSEYARLNEERKPVLDRIAREGTVYGR